MPAFGVNRFTQAYAVAVSDAGTRINDRPVSCVDKLVSDLWKWAGYKPVSEIFRFLYPFVGGTAVSNSFNLANPSSGRIEWEGALVHNANGVTGDGVSGAGRTGVSLAGVTVADSYVALGVYSRTASSIIAYEIGNYTTKGIILACRWTDGAAKYYIGTAVSGLGPAVSNSQGFFSMLRYSGGFFCYRNGIALASNVSAGVVLDPALPFIILANYTAAADDTLFQWSSRNLAFAFLTNIGVAVMGDQAGLYPILQSFQTRLGRQV